MLEMELKLARLANLARIVLMRLELESWFEWVPLAINWADFPSSVAILRKEEATRQLLEQGFEVYDSVLPSFDQMMDLRILLTHDFGL